MKIKKNCIAISLLILFALSINAFAQDDKAKEGNIDVSLTFVSGYLWRGFDLYTAKFAQDKKKQGAFNFVPSLAPDITFSSPTLEGLSFNIWAQAPLTGRDDTDTGAGLKNFDEVDYTVGYEHKSRFGTFSANYIIFSFPMAGANYSELGFGFSIEPIKNLSMSLTHNVALGGSFLTNATYNATTADATTASVSTESGVAGGLYGSETYSTLGIGYTITAGSIEIAPSVSLGYWDIPDENVNGINGDNYAHVDFGLDASFSVNEKIGISFGALGSYRLFTDNQKSGLDPEDITKTYDFPPLIAQVSFGVAYSL